MSKMTKFVLGFLILSFVFFLGSCTYRVQEALEWDYKNKCAAGLKPVVKIPCK